MNKNKTKKAFSLVELLVVLAIIMIMTGAVFLQQGKNKGQSDAENAALQIVAQLRTLQNEALNGKVVDGKSACTFELKIDSVPAKGSNTYDIKYYECPPTSAFISKTTTTFKKAYILGDGTGGGALTIDFLSPQGNYNANGLGTNNGYKKIKVTSLDGNATMSVCINSMGRISSYKGDQCKN